MPFEVSLPSPIHGYNETAVREGEQASIRSRGFISSEDGDMYIKYMEGVPAILLHNLPNSINALPSMVDHLLAIIRPDQTVTVYINELRIELEIKARRDIAAGQPILEDDIADVNRLKLTDINIPSDAGFLFIFSIGWQKGFYFDFTPLLPEEHGGSLRTYDVQVALGQYYAYLSFRYRFKLTEDQWNALYHDKWFPFISLRPSTIRSITQSISNGWSITDAQINQVALEVAEDVPEWLRNWAKIPAFAEHMPFLTSAVERYIDGDYISAGSILYPRIEGIMRSNLLLTAPSTNASQSNLAATAVDVERFRELPYSLLLPQRFHDYLRRIYFASFVPQGDRPLSRNSVSHGVAEATDFNKKGVALALLIVDQLSHYLSAESSENTDVQAS